jgi:hypothetical protein
MSSNSSPSKTLVNRRENTTFTGLKKSTVDNYRASTRTSVSTLTNKTAIVKQPTQPLKNDKGLINKIKRNIICGGVTEKKVSILKDNEKSNKLKSGSINTTFASKTPIKSAPLKVKIINATPSPQPTKDNNKPEYKNRYVSMTIKRDR